MKVQDSKAKGGEKAVCPRPWVPRLQKQMMDSRCFRVPPNCTTLSLSGLSTLLGNKSLEIFFQLGT